MPHHSGPAYEAALKELHEKIQKIKINCFDHCRSINRWPLDKLKHTGHKTREDGIVWSVRNSIREVEKITDEFIKKYPD